MDRLISMVAFVKEQVKRKVSVVSHMICIEDYANFLSQKLELWMFIPCKLVDGVWVVLEEPDPTNWQNLVEFRGRIIYRDCEYQEAKDRVLFVGFEITLNGNCIICMSNESTSLDYSKSVNLFSGLLTIEDLVKYNLELTDSAKRQLGI